MGKQIRSKKTDSLGKGKVTPMQVAFIVDRYLCDNNFSETRSAFRTEASSLIAKSPVQEAPKSLLSLGAMLNEYISLKEQKVMVDQEKARLEQEKFRVQTLLQGMQEAMNVYNSGGSGSATVPMIQASATKPPFVVPQPDPRAGSSGGLPMYKSPNVMPVSMPSNTSMHHGNLSTPITNRPITRKRAGSNVALEAPLAAKRSRGKLLSMKLSSTDKQCSSAAITQETALPSSATVSSPHNRTGNGSSVQVSSVAKSLFNQPSLSPPASSSVPNTPPQAVSSQNEQSISPVVNTSNADCSNSNTPQEVTPPNCTIITTERLMVSPCKHMAYYSMERNHCISSSSPVKSTSKRLTKRDCVKGRLDFDGSDATTSLDKPVVVDPILTSESDKEGDIFDLELPNFDVFGANFSFSELLVDLDLGCDGIVCPCQPSTDTLSGSSHESRDGNLGTDQILSEFSSTATEIISGTDVNVEGSDTLTALKSITKCIRIVSPAKNQRNSYE